jgi:hypothetical protein
MKSIKMLGLAMVAALGLTMIVGEGAASATVLCKTLSDPCSEDYPAQTQIKAEASPEIGGASFLESESGFSMECPRQSLTTRTTNTGSSTETVLLDNESLTFTECPGQCTSIPPAPWKSTTPPKETEQSQLEASCSNTSGRNLGTHAGTSWALEPTSAPFSAV